MCMIISQLLYTVNNNLLISFVLFLCWEFYCTDISLATDLYSRVMFYFPHKCSTRNICVYWFMDLLRRAKSPLVPRVEKSDNSDCVGCGFAVRLRARQYIYANRKSVDICIVHALKFCYCRAYFGSLLCSYSSLCILALRLGD